MRQPWRQRHSRSIVRGSDTEKSGYASLPRTHGASGLSTAGEIAAFLN
nr:MAG TPA_asm: hypothetical protein [Caudoviricetes sp.]